MYIVKLGNYEFWLTDGAQVAQLLLMVKDSTANKENDDKELWTPLHLTIEDPA